MPIFDIHPAIQFFAIFGPAIILFALYKFAGVKSHVAGSIFGVILGTECIIAKQVQYHSAYGIIDGEGAVAVGIGYLLMAAGTLFINRKKGSNQKVELTENPGGDF